MPKGLPARAEPLIAPWVDVDGRRNEIREVILVQRAGQRGERVIADADPTKSHLTVPPTG